jgi:hypothetical protein
MIEHLGGLVTDAENKHIVVYVIDGFAYLADNDSGNEFRLNADEPLVRGQRRRRP